MDAAPNMLAASTMPLQPGMMPSLQGPQNALSQVAQSQPQMLTDPRTGAQVPAPAYATPQYKPGKTPKQGDIPDALGEILPYENGGKLPPWTLPRDAESKSNGVMTYERTLDPREKAPGNNGGGIIPGSPSYYQRTQEEDRLLRASRPGDKLLYHDDKGHQMWMEHVYDKDAPTPLGPDGKPYPDDPDGEKSRHRWETWFPPKAGV